MICSRRGFLLGSLGAGALLVAPGCGPIADAPDGTVDVVNGMARLDFARFPDLMTPGNGVTVQTPSGTPFAVVRIDAQNAVAVNAVCTHQGCTATWVDGQSKLHCACHGSEFSAGGMVLRGPAPVPLSPTYPAAIDATGISVTIAG
jgi:Rieske Fe-S protein